MAVRDAIFTRLFSRFLSEVRSVTTPSIAIAVVLALAAFAFRYLVNGELPWKDAASAVIPAIWTACAFGCYCLIKAALGLRRKDLAAWEAWKPVVLGDVPRPPRPSWSGIAIATASTCGFFCVVFFVTLFAPKRQNRQGQTGREHEPVSKAVVLPAPVTPKGQQDYQHPPTPLTVKVVFKVSQLFTSERKRRITVEINSFYEYLTTIGFAPPTTVPPVGELPLPKRGGAVMASDCTSNIYGRRLDMRRADVDNPWCIRRLYAFYAFQVLFESDCDPKKNWEDFTALIFAQYYASSFAGKKDDTQQSKWVDALWEIRQKYGQNLVDTTLSFMFQNQMPRSSEDRTFDDYFGNRLRHAFYLADSRHNENMPGILAILEKHRLMRK